MWDCTYLFTTYAWKQIFKHNLKSCSPVLIVVLQCLPIPKIESELNHQYFPFIRENKCPSTFYKIIRRGENWRIPGLPVRIILIGKVDEIIQHWMLNVAVGWNRKYSAKIPLNWYSFILCYSEPVYIVLNIIGYYEQWDRLRSMEEKKL